VTPDPGLLLSDEGLWTIALVGTLNQNTTIRPLFSLLEEYEPSRPTPMKSWKSATFS